MDFTVEPSLNGPCAEIIISGEFDARPAEQVVTLAEFYLDHDEVERLIFDLSDVTFLDSAGIAALVRVHHLAETTGKSFAIRDPSDRVVIVLRLVGLDHEFTIEA